MIRRLAALGLAAALAAVPAAAQAPTYAERLRLTLDYDGRLIVKVLDVRVEQTVRDGAYTSTVRLVSYGILSLFKRLDQRASVSGRMRDGVPTPGLFRHQNLNTRRTQVTWTANDAVAVSTPPHTNLGDPIPTRAQRMESVDPLTHVLRMALTANGRNPCQAGTRRFYDGRQRYDLDFTFVGTAPASRRERSIGLTDTVRCSVRYREVAGFAPKPPERRNQGLRSAIDVRFGRFGAGGPWVMSQLTSPTPLGNAVIELRAGQVVYR